jgi:hypothetical protein
MGAVGRMPVFLNRERGMPPVFWGFAIALVRFPDVLQSAGLDWLPRRGYRYRLWRQHPDSHQVQVLASEHPPHRWPSRCLTSSTWPTAHGRWMWNRDGWRNPRHLSSIPAGAADQRAAGLAGLADGELRRNRAELALLVALRTRALEQETSDREAAEHAALAETMRQAALLQTASDGIHILMNKDG